jgi:D-sedoheptulose 7-phosphate isomerase
MAELPLRAVAAPAVAGHGPLVEARIAESIAAKRGLLVPGLVAQVGRLADLLIMALRGGGKAIFFGNGGSAADATHLAAEFVGRFQIEREPLAALSLTDNASSVSAIGNDYAYEETFARQVRGLGRPGDVAIGLSTSGTSPNVVRGLQAAADHGLRTAALTGAGGGALRQHAELCLEMPATATARVQECYMLVGHTVCEIVEQTLFAP